MADLHYTEKGSGHPVVLLHAFPADARIWKNQLDALSDSYRIIAIDLPGFGQSPAMESFTMDLAARAVHDQLKKMNALPCVIGGVSMGGYISLAFYQHYAADVDGLLLIDTRPAGDTAEAKRRRDELIEEVNRCGPSVVVDDMMPKVLSNETVAAQPDVVTEVRQMMQDCSVGAIRQGLAALRDRPDRTELLASIAEPVLIVVGECDTITTPQEARRTQEALPHAELAVIADAGHFSPIENPEEVSEAIRAFLAKIFP